LNAQFFISLQSIHDYNRFDTKSETYNFWRFVREPNGATIYVREEPAVSSHLAGGIGKKHGCNLKELEKKW